MAKSPEAKRRATLRFRERHRDDPVWRAKKRAINQAWKDANPDAYVQPSYRFSSLKRRAKVRGLEVSLTLSEYSALIDNKSCHYCGLTTISFGSGIDRVDSTKGYTLTNSVPCCYICNVMKSNLSIDAFYEQVERIADHRKR
jgi:hypothetical protein